MKKRYYLYFLALIIAFIFAVGDVSALFAQETAEDEFTLEEITVTAQKRVENQQKVPIAMEVISGESLATQGKTNVDDILKSVANVSIQNTSEGMRVSMRGITDDSNAQDGQHVGGSTVAINVDGAFNNMENVGTNLFDVERVEVLFGPQSTMYGSNAPGGIVNVITAAPKTDRFSASATQEIGNYSTYNTQAAVNVPIVQDKFAARLSASRNVQDSFVQDGVRSNNTKSVRLKALWNAYEQLSITVTGTWNKMINGGGNASSVIPFDNKDGSWYTSTTIGDGPDARVIWSKDGKVKDPWTWNGEGVGNNNDQVTKGLTGEISWKTAILNATAVPSYNKSTSKGHGSRTERGEYREFDEGRGNTQKGAELRMTNADDFTLFQWILGGTYYKSEMSNYTIYTNVAVTPNTQDTTQSKKAIYGNIVYPVWFSDRLRVTGGYRQSWDSSNTVAPGPGGGGLTTSGSPKYSKPDVKYGFEYDTSEDSMVFGSFATSYRSGNGMAMPDASGNYPKNEELKAYTLGAKSRWFGNKLQVNASVYYYDYRNKLCTGFKAAYGIDETIFGYDAIKASYDERRGSYNVAIGADGNYPTMDPTDPTKVWTFDLHDQNSQGTGDFSSKGVDIQTSWIMTSADKMDLSVSYMDETWKDLKFHYYWYMIFPDVNFKGVTPANAPKWSITADYEHNFIIGEYGMLTPRLDVQYKSKYTLNADPTNPDTMGFSKQESYVKYDVSATFTSAMGNWSLNLYCKNVTDYAAKTMYRNMQGDVSLNLSEPRRYGATVSVKF